jgi:hypothetical protein
LVEQEYLTYLFLNNSSQRYIPNWKRTLQTIILKGT